jgi:transcription termination/antitermination protein NusA
VKLSDVIDELVDERGLERSMLSSIICEGILAAYTKKYPHLELRVEHNKKSDDIAVYVAKKVSSVVESEEDQISLRKARLTKEDAQVGDVVWVPFEGNIGRIEILRAKQIIAGKIRSIEAMAIYNEFKDKEKTIVHGVVHKCERGGAVVKLHDTMAFLPKSLTIPGDQCIVGHPIRALLKDVLPEPRNDNQLILDRVSDLFLQRLFELEIPEVFEKLVEIKKIVRIPGYKSKVAVVSNDKNIDPVGTCVGVGGARIKPILKELGGEKIDIIAWSDVPAEYVKDALKPAQVSKVQMVGSDHARVFVQEDQRSLAIGKMGQNVALASRLTDINITLAQEENERDKQEQDELPTFD